MKKMAFLILGGLLVVGGLVLIYLLGPGATVRLQSLLRSDHVAHDHSVEYWTCPMHLSVRADEPGTCPICGMDLTPVHREEERDEEHEEQQVPARTEFTVDPYRQQLINVQTSVVELRTLQHRIRTVGLLELDETTIFNVNPRISGWIQEVFVNYRHQHVHEGQPLLSIYSPELVASQEEYLLAIRTAEQLSSSSFEHVSSGARSLVQAARRRLELFDLGEAQIRELERTGEVQTDVVLHSPVSGFVLERNAFSNRYVRPEDEVYVIADHSRIWANVQIYESDIAHVRVGQPATMRSAAYPGREFHGRISFIEPHLDGKTRTLRARLEFPNPDFTLKPEMYVEVELQVSLGRQVAVPDSAVLRTGVRDLVFVERGEGRMEMRKVQVGAKAGGYYQVLDGLSSGERVVTSANFLIDSESKIRGIEGDWDTPRPQQHVH